MPQIEVTFDIDANGILHVSAKDLGTGKDQKITIQGSSGLSKEEVEKMTKEAELHAEEDRKRKESVEAKNQLDSTIYQLEKSVKEAGDKLPAGIKSKAEDAIKDAKKDLESNDTDRMKAAMEKLSAVGGEIYQEAQKAAQAAGAAASGQPQQEAPKSEASGKKQEKKADVVDADFEVVDEDKKK
jgi:molecular chaperone DnaK